MKVAAPEYVPPADGFLGLTSAQAGPPDEARAVVVPFGLEASVSYGGGTTAGPAAIIAASHQVELFDDELWCEPAVDVGLATLAAAAIPGDIPAALDSLDRRLAPLVEAGRLPLVLGGEHSLTAGAIRPFLRHHGSLAILHLDAHADLRDGYDGEHYSHASAMRRCLDHDNVALVSAGIRSISSEEIPFLDSNTHRIHLYWARERERWNPDEWLAPLRGMPIYVSVDVDVFDSSLMPATGTPEPGGLMWDDVIALIRAASRVGRIVGADVTELAPRDGWHACDFLAAKLAYKIIAFATHA